MLESLHIRNIVLIDQLLLTCARGLSALTGETGAGKSILLDSLGLALGARADSGLVRAGTEDAYVIATFSPSDSVQDFLKAQGIVTEDQIILRRQVFADGKSKAFINDQPTSVALLRQVGARLVEIHGQFDTQALLDPAEHLAILDQFAGHDVLLNKVQQTYRAWQKAEQDLRDVQVRAESARQQEQFLQQAVEDLGDLAPMSGEEQVLMLKRHGVQHRTLLLEAAQTAYDALQGESGADAAIMNAIKVLAKASSRAGGVFDETVTRLEALRSELDPIATSLSVQADPDQDNDLRLEQIDDRLHALRQMARRYGVEVAVLPEKLEEFRTTLALAGSQDEALAKFQAAARGAALDYQKHAESLSDARKDAARKIDKAVMRELPPLKLEKATFCTTVTRASALKDWGPNGFDRVAFEVATNPGAAPGPLAKIASGGEMARFMLALKVVLTGRGGPACLVFDEVDSGISGATADAVGQRLARLAQDKQVLVVTHSPQVAALADHHFIVRKQADKTKTITTVMPLDDSAAKREEIARMLSGAQITEEARAAARKLLERQAA